ncbi:MAG: dihydrofolate reductase family protein [Acidobacteriota bacterium]
MRHIEYHVATSIDGFIAHPDGSWDGFLQEGPHVADYLASFERYDTVLMGRHTYEAGLRQGVTNPYPQLVSLVFSRRLEASPDPAVELVKSDAAARVRELKERPGKAIYLCGGGRLASSLLAAGLLDELVLKLNPVVFGDGIPLFSERHHQALDLTHHQVYDNGVQLLHYRFRN